MSDSTRSVAHPIYTLSSCLDFIAKLYPEFGLSHYATREQIAKVLNQSPSSVQQRVSTCSQYGLFELKSKVGYKIEDVYKKIYRPENDVIKRQYLLELFRKPLIYSLLIEKFNGDVLPSEATLANILFQQFSISERACENAAKIFRENIIELGILNDSNELDMGSEKKAEPKDVIIHEEQPGDQFQYEEPIVVSQSSTTNFKRNPDFEKRASTGNTNDNRIPFNIPLKRNRTAQIVIPESVTASDFDTIINWIRLMRESYVE